MPRPRRADRTGIAFAAIGSLVLFGPLLYFAWPRSEAPTDEDATTESSSEPTPDAGTDDGPPPAVVDRNAPMLFQPVLVWADDSVTVQGTGFTVTHADRRFAVTSSHYVVPSEVPLERLAFGSLPGMDKLGATTVAWGPMGPCESESADDMRDDYLVMPIEGIEGLQPLELDPRDEIPVGELVWFPDKSDDAKAGHVVHTGRVTHSTLGVIEIALDQPIVLESQSGSPVLSETSNRVLGILGGADSEAGNRLYFAPASMLRAVMEDDVREPVELTHALLRWIPAEPPTTEGEPP